MSVYYKQWQQLITSFVTWESLLLYTVTSKVFYWSGWVKSYYPFGTSQPVWTIGLSPTLLQLFQCKYSSSLSSSIYNWLDNILFPALYFYDSQSNLFVKFLYGKSNQKEIDGLIETIQVCCFLPCPNQVI